MSDDTRIDKSDRVGLYLSVAIAAIGIALVIIGTVGRLIEVASGGDIPVRIPLDGESAQLPLGPDGELIAADVNTATVMVSDPAPATLFAMWAHPIVDGLAWSAGLIIVAMFFLRLARAQVFTRGTARLMYVASGVLVFGWFAGSLLTNMTTNGAMSAISDYTYDSITFTANLAPMLGVLGFAAVGVALQLGEKLQRETEGLV